MNGPGFRILIAGGILLLLPPFGSALAADEGENPHGAYVEDCALCHSKDAWKPAVISPKFDHSKYAFKLTGAHAGLACRACHVSLDFKKASSNCVDCHLDVHKGELGLDCSVCHTTRNFIERSDDVRRHRQTRFPLQGAHAVADCSACHRPSSSGQATYVNTPTDCEICHLDAFQAAKNPDHVAAGFPRDCSRCHLTTTWLAKGFDHALFGFPLTGAHATLACSDCHPNNKFSGAQPDCFSCHGPNYQQTSNPSHSSAGFDTNCASCHSTKAWQPSNFNHASTGFPLTGAHRGQSCAACHPNGVYTSASPLCSSCHQLDYDTAANPDHKAAMFPADCTRCHSTTAWRPSTFNHGATAFPLTGAHSSLACNACHGDGVYAGKSSACVSCHQNDYDATTNPAHAAAGFPTDCAQCHTTTTWQGAKFAHDTFFPIYSGVHRGKWSRCDTCHINPSSYADFSCFGCHPHSDKSKTDGNHGGVGGYVYDSHACYTCHPRGRAGN